MFFLPSSVHIFVASTATDLRKSFDGLSTLVGNQLQQDPLSGNLYVFYNKRRNQVRVLFFDRTGYCIFAKRLAEGTFRFTESAGEMSVVEIEAAELSLILEGIELRGAQRRRRWRPEKKKAA